jgi:hypothetical protein
MLTIAHHDALERGQVMALSLAVYQNVVRFHLQFKRRLQISWANSITY